MAPRTPRPACAAGCWTCRPRGGSTIRRWCRGLLADECGKLLQRFFAERRAQRRADRAALRAQQDELARWAASLPAEEETGTLHLDEPGD